MSPLKATSHHRVVGATASTKMIHRKVAFPRGFWETYSKWVYYFAPSLSLKPHRRHQNNQKTTGGNPKPWIWWPLCSQPLSQEGKSFRKMRVDKDTRVKTDSFLLNKTFKLTTINTHWKWLDKSQPGKGTLLKLDLQPPRGSGELFMLWGEEEGPVIVSMSWEIQ